MERVLAVDQTGDWRCEQDLGNTVFSVKTLNGHLTKGRLLPEYERWF